MMQDEELIRLYVTRSERAIALTSDKYGGYCHTIAYQILKDLEDSEECVNDTYWKAWNVIPPTMPKCFKAFLGKITRNLALHRWEKNSTKKRGGNQIPFLLDELAECIPSQEDIPKKVEDAEICALCNQFLEMLSKEKRMVFVRRYWYCDSVSDIAKMVSFWRKQSEDDAVPDTKRTSGLSEKGRC